MGVGRGRPGTRSAGRAGVQCVVQRRKHHLFHWKSGASMGQTQALGLEAGVEGTGARHGMVSCIWRTTGTGAQGAITGSAQVAAHQENWEHLTGGWAGNTGGQGRGWGKKKGGAEQGNRRQQWRPGKPLAATC